MNTNDGPVWLNKRRTVRGRTKLAVILLRMQLPAAAIGSSSWCGVACEASAKRHRRRRLPSRLGRNRRRVYPRNLLRVYRSSVKSPRSRLKRARLSLKGVSHYIFRDDPRHFYGKSSRYAPIPRLPRRDGRYGGTPCNHLSRCFKLQQC